MKKKVLLIAALAAALVLAGCGAEKQTAVQTQAVTTESIAESTTENTTESTAESTEESTAESAAAVLADGVYLAEFDTDSSMFKVNEAKDGKGVLTVEDGQMTIHISLVSKKILNLYPGTAEDAAKPDAVLLEPTLDTVTYSDGLSDEVYGFDVPVPYLDDEFDLALIGTKGTWYDHKVSVSNPVPYTEETSYEDGSYTIEVSLEGGSGRASITSPCTIRIENGLITAVIEWSSPNYDFMIVGGEEYLPVNTEGNSVFEIPAGNLGEPLSVQADTIAMSQPHLIDYTITFDTSTLQAQ